jgi:3-oxoacyl-[acyl-carrier-protein] synthase III
MQHSCYITATGQFLPGEPISNDEMEARLGQIGSKPSTLRTRVLRQNGIVQRYYALDENQQTLYTNAEMAARAAREAMGSTEVDLLVAATSQGDLPIPGFASMVQGELKLPRCEIATLHGVCASSVLALRHASMAIQTGGTVSALCVASEFPSRLLKASRFQAQGYGEEKSLPYETEFLRWMLSDGAGALLLQNTPAAQGLSLKIEHIALHSYAGDFPPCMFVGKEEDVYAEQQKGWLDYPDYAMAAQAGAINLHQNVRLLKDVVEKCVSGVFALVEQRVIDAKSIDWWVTHYSSHLFREQAYELLVRGGLTIPQDRIFTNLYTSGNVGAASFPLMLGDLLNSGKLEPGQRLLCIVPESGRFLFGYVVLKVVGSPLSPLSEHPPLTPPLTSIAPDIKTTGSPLEESLVRQLTLVWTDFATQLHRVPIVEKIETGKMTLTDYQDLLYNLRQQVIDGSRWISRVASNITPEYFFLRSAFIGHSQDEHRDFEMIERDYVRVGGDLAHIQNGTKNVGSAALSEFILSRASRENPFDLVGAMFIIEGLGRRVAGEWGRRIQEQLQLTPDQVSFLLYHAASDDIHFKRLDAAVQSGVLTEKLIADTVKTARVVARLYILQLEEIGNF